MGPFRDAQSAAVVLLLDGVADVDEFAVFENEEVVLLGQCLQAIDGGGAEIRQDIDVGFNDGNVWTEA